MEGKSYVKAWGYQGFDNAWGTDVYLHKEGKIDELVEDAKNMKLSGWDIFEVYVLDSDGNEVYRRKV